MTLFTFAERRGVDEGTVLLVGILLLGIFMPTVFFFAYQIFKRRRAIPIKMRYPVITFWFTLFFCLKLSISGAICLSLWKDKTFSEWAIYKPLLILDNTFLFLFLYLNVWKLWCIKYDLNWASATLSDDAWRILINESESTSAGYGNVSWYFKHKVTCCCPGYLCPIIPLIIVLVGINIPVMLYGYNSPFAIFISRCIYITVISIMLLIYILTPKRIAGQVPNFEINKELRMVFIVNLLILLICIAGFVYDLYYANQYVEFAKYNQRNVNVLIEESLLFAGEWFLCLFQTFYVLAKTGEFLPFYLRRRKRGTTDVLGVMNGKNTRELQEVLSNNKLFPWFISHLASENLISIMLALIEFVQFQRYCANYYKSHGSEYIQLKSDRIRIPLNAPESSIVYENAEFHAKANLNEFFNYALEKYYKLYKKYMGDKSSKLKLPLTPKTQQYFDDILGNENKWLFENDEVQQLTDLMQHLDKAIAEIYHLADDSWRRFLQLNQQKLFNDIPELYMNTLSA